MKRRILSALGVLLLLSVLIIPVSAAVPDASRIGSISVTMTHDGDIVPGGTLTIYRVAELDLTGEFGYTLVAPYINSGISLEDIGSARTAAALAQYTRRNRIEGTTERIGRNGKVTFENLQTGLYLVMQHDPADGYSALDPFLVSIPALDETDYIYDVDASPKMDLEPEVTRPTRPTTEPTVPSDDKLPQTGQTNWPIPVLAVGGLFLIVSGWCLRSTGRKKADEE